MDRARSIVLFFSGFFLFCFSSQVVWSQDIVSAWGRNDFGQATPPVGAFTAVSGGGDHTCGMRTDGTAACWGKNTSGEATPPPGFG